MRYVDEFLYNMVAELRLWRDRRRSAAGPGAGPGAVASRLGPLAGAFGAHAGRRAVPTTGVEADRPLR